MKIDVSLSGYMELKINILFGFVFRLQKWIIIKMNFNWNYETIIVQL